MSAVSACDFYQLLGDTAQMKRHGCPIPLNATRILKTIPVGGARGEETDEDIANVFSYILLGILLIIAISMICVCCCRAYKRMAARRALLYSQFGRKGVAMASSGRPGPCSTCSPYLPTQTRPMQAGNMQMLRPVRPNPFGDECHQCQTLNLV